MQTYKAGENGDRELRYAGTREWVFPLLATRRYRDRVSLLSGLELRRRPDCEPTLHSIVTDSWTPETVHHIGWCESCRAAGLALGGAFAGTSPGKPMPVGSPGRRRAAWIGVAAACAIAAPIVASQVIDNPFAGGANAVRGGSSHVIAQGNGTGSTGTNGSAGSSSGAGANGGTGTTGGKGSASGNGSTGSNGSSNGSSGANGGTGSNSGTGSNGTSGAGSTTPIVPVPRKKHTLVRPNAHHAHVVLPVHPRALPLTT